MEHSKTIRKDAGFTLVELAIVMVIIGLLIGGVLKGQELITNARAGATVAMVKGIEAAVNTFQDAYDAIPGDIVNPGQRLPNCLGALCNVPVNAVLRGNRRLETGLAGIMGVEAQGFFTQLAAADLIGDVDAQANAMGPWQGQLTRFAPEAPIGGGFHVGFTNGANNGGFPDIRDNGNANTPRRGLWVAIHDAPGAANISAGAGPILQPSHALRIDNKMDDGLPGVGFVRGIQNNGNCSIDNNNYNGTRTQNDCVLYIRLGG